MLSFQNSKLEKEKRNSMNKKNITDSILDLGLKAKDLLALIGTLLETFLTAVSAIVDYQNSKSAVES